jgi:hypothetical protein
MPHKFFRVLLCLFFYFVSVDVVGRIAEAVGYVLVLCGSPELWKDLHEHPFGRSLVVGLLAGFIPLQTLLSASGFINVRYTQILKRLNPDGLKSWIFVFFSPVIILCLLSWMIDWFALRSRHSSVLQTTSPYPMSEFFDGFLSTNCSNFTDLRGDMWGERWKFSCLIHVQLISIWMLTIGYSLAPFVRKRILPLLRGEHPMPTDESPTEILQESTMTETTDSDEDTD